MLRGISRTFDGMLDPRPAVGSPAIGGQRTPPSGFFQYASYLGAFGLGQLGLQLDGPGAGRLHHPGGRRRACSRAASRRGDPGDRRRHRGERDLDRRQHLHPFGPGVRRGRGDAHHRARHGDQGTARRRGQRQRPGGGPWREDLRRGHCRGADRLHRRGRRRRRSRGLRGQRPRPVGRAHRAGPLDPQQPLGLRNADRGQHRGHRHQRAQGRVRRQRRGRRLRSAALRVHPPRGHADRGRQRDQRPDPGSGGQRHHRRVHRGVRQPGRRDRVLRGHGQHPLPGGGLLRRRLLRLRSGLPRQGAVLVHHPGRRLGRRRGARRGHRRRHQAAALPSR